jgi:phosphate transport system permease protein
VARALAARPTPTVEKLGCSSNARSRRIVDRVATAVLWTAASLVVFLLLLFIGFEFVKGASSISWQFLTGSPTAAEAGGGVGPLIFNSFYILILTLIFTVPIAVCSGMYLQEYAAGGRFKDLVQFSAESLATVPSIVMGLFGLLIFVTAFHWHFTAIGGALTLTLLNLPAMMRVTQEALAGVPGTYREASMGLGATKWQTVLKVILPSAIGPLTTGVVLVSGRIFGETAALIYTAGASVSYGRSAYDFNPFHTAETLAVGLYQVHREALVPDVDRIANGSALVLLVMVLVFNVVARVVGRQLTIRFTGKA